MTEDEQPCKQCGKDIHITHLNEEEHQFGHHKENMQGPYCNQECWAKGSNYNPKKSNDRAFSTGWAVIKSGMNPRLPKEGSMDGVLSRNPDPPAMNAGMPRDPDLLARLKRMKERKDKEIKKTQINRVKSPSPDAKAGSHKCRECDNQGGALPCKSCGYMKTPTGKQRQTKPSQRNNKNYQILRSDIEKKKMKWGYKSDRGQKPAPKLPTPKKDKNKIK